MVGYAAPDTISRATEKVAFDDQHKVVYLASSSQLSALDASAGSLPGLSSSSSSSLAAAALPLLSQQQLPAAVADVAVCGGLVAVAAEGAGGKAAPGQLLLFAAYDKSAAAAAADSEEEGKGLSILANITVGASPASAAFSRDCQTLLVANGGQADCAAGAAGCSDPEGSVSVVIIRYCPDPAQTAPCGESRLRYKVLTAGFAAWDDKGEALLQAGVRLDAASKVSQELIPEHVTFSEDEAVAFLALKAASAVAVLHVASASITGIFPLASQQQQGKPSSSIKALGTADSSTLAPEAITSFSDKGTDYLLIAAGSSFSVLRAAYEPAAAAAAATPEARMPGSPRKGLEQRIAQLTALFDSGTQLSSIGNEAGVAEGAAAAAGRAGVAVGDCPGYAAAAARRCAFVAVRGIAAVFVYDISDPAAPVFQSLVLPPKANAGAEASAFDAQTGIAYAKYSQGDAGSVPVLLVSYEGQAAGVHGLGMYKLQAQ
uniref:Choice-of-anchor I domain-containing protein n=1 Tax=Tetradesmus obliquus TaxID=3088 RepID=A0A383V8J6_TETOB|eukprot:jgi/Sobl393_1/14273/SZX61491.1